MSVPTPEIVKAFHAAYVRETGLPLALLYNRESAWFRLLRVQYGEPPADLTVEDLVMVIRYLRSGIAKGERNAGCLRFRNLIEQPDYFEEELAMARKAASQRQRPKAREVQETTRQPDGGTVTRLAQHAPEIEPVEASEESKRFMEEMRRRKARRLGQQSEAGEVQLRRKGHSQVQLGNEKNQQSDISNPQFPK